MRGHPNMHSETISSLIDRAPIGTYHWRIFLICGLVAVMDGFDSVIIGITAPAIARSLQIDIATFGPIFAAAQIGFMLGAFGAGPAADRWGRKRMLCISTLLFAAATISTVAADDFSALLLIRIVTGIGLGGAATNFIALCSDFAPSRARATILAVLWAMIPAGNVFGGVLSSWMLPAHGWQSIYLVGGLVPAAAACAIFFLVPESLSFLARDDRHRERVTGILRRLGAADTWQPPGTPLPTQAKTKVPVSLLLSRGNGATTAWVWLSAFACWMMLLTLLSWMAPLMIQLGIPASRASLGVAANSAGAIVGALILGRLMDRIDRYIVCAISLGVGAVATALTGVLAGSFASLAAMAFVLGFTVGGASAGIMAIVATIYPDQLRSTGIGWTIGVARLGGAIGPIIAGIVLQAGASAAQIFALLAVPCLISVVSLLGLRSVRRTKEIPQPANGMDALGASEC